MTYNPRVALSQMGRHSLIEDGSEQALVVYSASSAGLSVAQTTILLNEFRQRQVPSLGPICITAVNDFVTSSEVMEKNRRLSKKSRTADPHSVWARARVAQAAQFLGSLYGNDADDVPPFQLHDVAWWDENHERYEQFYYLFLNLNHLFK